MAITSGLPISITDIATEYGDTLPYSLSEYLGESGAPTGTPYSITDWQGLSAVSPLFLIGTVFSYTNISPGNAYAGVKVASDGYIESAKGSTLTYVQDGAHGWSTDAGTGGFNPSLYEARMVPSSGAFSGSSSNTWISCGLSPAWYVSETGIGSSAATGTISVREIANTSNIVSDPFSCIATVDP